MASILSPRVLLISLGWLVLSELSLGQTSDMDTNLGHARTYFRRHDYRTALLALQNKSLDLPALWIAGESLFRLGRYSEAQTYFERIVKESADPVEKRKAHIRLFDVEIYAKDIQAAINRYVAFGKQYRTTPARMRYALGKALFDLGYFDRAEKVLRGIPKTSEFFIRARYIIATLGLDKKTPQASAKIFRQIESLKPISVEDYAVHQLAILAQARIYADANREDLAQKAYERVSITGPFGEVALSELIRMMLIRAELASAGEGRFKRTSQARRQFIETEAINAALAALMRYRKAHEIDWRKPELLTLMATLFGKAKRYEEAQLAYKELIDHYRPIQSALLAKENADRVWYYFALDFNRDKPNNYSMLAGVPDFLLKNIPQIKKILQVRDGIEATEKALRDLESRAVALKLSKELLVKARTDQNAIINAYQRMVIKQQQKIAQQAAVIINDSLAEAEFMRGKLALLEINDLQKQKAALQDFQSDKIEMFEDSLKKLDEGGSS